MNRKFDKLSPLKLKPVNQSVETQTATRSINQKLNTWIEFQKKTCGSTIPLRTGIDDFTDPFLNQHFKHIAKSISFLSLESEESVESVESVEWQDIFSGHGSH